MNREQKRLDTSMEIMIQRLNEMKASLSKLIMRVENDHTKLKFPDVLDAFAVICGQVGYINYIIQFLF